MHSAGALVAASVHIPKVTDKSYPRPALKLNGVGVTRLCDELGINRVELCVRYSLSRGLLSRIETGVHEAGNRSVAMLMHAAVEVGIPWNELFLIEFEEAS